MAVCVMGVEELPEHSWELRGLTTSREERSHKTWLVVGSPHFQCPTNTKKNTISLSVRPGDSDLPKHSWPDTSLIFQVRKPQRGNVSCAPNQLFHGTFECLFTRNLQTWTLHTPPRGAEAPSKAKPSCARAGKESTQETHSGEAFAECVPNTMK